MPGHFQKTEKFTEVDGIFPRAGGRALAKAEKKLPRLLSNDYHQIQNNSQTQGLVPSGCHTKLRNERGQSEDWPNFLILLAGAAGFEPEGLANEDW